jgi:type I restriction enzyme M protein
MNQHALSAIIWSVADLLRGDYKQSEYGKVILPFTVLRRLDCVLEPTKDKVLAESAARKKEKVNPDHFLRRKSGAKFYNASPLNLPKLMGDQDHIRQNLENYIAGFSPKVRDIFDNFEFETQVERLAKAKLLYQVTEKFANIDLHPKAVDNHQMGLIFEELIRRFAELSNETAGEHFTPREVIRLMVNLIFIEDDDVLSKEGVVRTLYDPTAGTGGMLSVAGEYLAEHNPKARLTVSGQELNPESYAICKADMLIKGHDVSKIAFGNTLSEDGHPGERFDYMLANPPFGVEWKKVEKEVRKEHEQQGFNGRFGPGLPTDMFYNTGIVTYVWIVSNRKPRARRGKVQLIDASLWWQKMRKSLGSKCKELADAHIERITRLFGEFREESDDGKPVSRIFRNEEVGYRTITVERPLKDERGKPVLGAKGRQKGKPLTDSAQRDTENVPLTEDVERYFRREVLPHAPDAWIGEEKTKIGYEIPFNRHFYVFTPPRPLAEIDADLKRVSSSIMKMLGEVAE